MPSSTAVLPSLRERGGLPVLTWPVFDELAVEALVTTRDGGVSTGPYASLDLGLHVGDAPERVIVNRRRAAAALGVDLDDLVFGAQTHGRGVATVTRADRGRGAERLDDAVPDVDALVTADDGVALAVLVADCAPLVLVDPVARVVGVVHAGWRGTVAGVAAAAVEAMATLGSRPADVVAALGPAVPAERYQVGSDVADAVRHAFGAAADDVLVADAEERWRLDLRAANRLVLQEVGVPAGQVHVAEASTGGDGPFFSDRAERPCGRFAALVRLRPECAT